MGEKWSEKKTDSVFLGGGKNSGPPCICLLQPNNNLGSKGKVLPMSLMAALYSLIQEKPTLIFKCLRKTHGKIWIRNLCEYKKY